MLPRLTERFEDWLCMPISYASPDPRVALRCFDERRFEEAFDIIDAAFGVTRPRATYDWLYRRNPCGLARCVGAFEVSTGRMVAVSVEWPWPAAHHDTALPGTLNGDRATAPDWQRQGLYGIFPEFRRHHPWQGLRISWPNAGSRRAFDAPGPSGGADRTADARHRRARCAPASHPSRRARSARRSAGARGGGGADWAGGGSGSAVIGSAAVAPVDHFDARFDAATAARYTTGPATGVRTTPSS